MGGSVEGLNGITSFTKVRALGADVAYFQYPVSRQLLLNAQVPLLRAGGDKVPRDFQSEQVDAVASENAVRMSGIPEGIGLAIIENGALASVRGGRAACAISKAEKRRIDGNEGWINHSPGRQSARTDGEDIRHVSGGSNWRRNRKNRSRKR